MKKLILWGLSGVLLSLSWPTKGWVFLIFGGLVPLLLLEHDISQSQRKRKGWAVFLGSYINFLIWNIFTTGWLYYSQSPDGSPALMAVIFPVVVNSLLMSLTFQFYHWFKRKQEIKLSLVFLVVVWMTFEKFHLEWEFTWPWLHLGNVFAEQPHLVQWYEFLGATGGSFWVLIINVLIFYTCIVWKKLTLKEKWLKQGLILGIIIVPMGISIVRYHQFNEKPMGKIRVMMLQPNLDPYTEKYQKDSIQIVQELLDLTKTTSQKIDYYISPETSIPGRGGISERGFHHSETLKMVKNLLLEHPRSIFAGGVDTYKVFQENEKKPNNATYYPAYNFWVENYNSAMQVIPNQPYQVYHKGKLVPGVEIFPYMSVLKPILGDAMLDFGGAMASLGTDKERKVFGNPYHQGKLAPIICYESIYGEYTGEYVQNGANFLAIMTNDSWWGVSEGHRQLLAYARLRAIETRREIARAANSGISAHINARGDIVSQTKYGEKASLVADIQLYNGETYYVKKGDFLSRICMMWGLFLLFQLIFGKMLVRVLK